MTEKTETFFKQIRDKRIVVAGDAMLDAYIWGDVKRISPEAPVPVVLVKNKEYRLGGAANVALNLKNLGADPVFVSVVGDDTEGHIFKDIMKVSGLSAEFIISSKNRPTTQKTRIIANNQQQLLRIDEENTGYLNDYDQTSFIENAIKAIAGSDAVVFSDYDKGVFSDKVIEKMVDEANRNSIPTIVDPKKRNFLLYKNVSLFKPNLKELAEGLGIIIQKPVSLKQLNEASDILFEKMNISIAFITLSDEGVFIRNKENSLIIPSHKRSIYDVSGAGDTVAAVAALALSCNSELKMIAELSNIAGGLVCEKVGVVPIELKEFEEECKRIFSH